MKKFWKYFLIVILSLVGLAAIGVLYLFFIPGSSLFGLCYISLNENHFSTAYSVDSNSVETVRLNSRNYDVEIVATKVDSNEIYVKVYANSFGFVLKKYSTVSINANLTAGSLQFDVSEPKGACVKNNSKITLFIPEGFGSNLILSNNNANTVLNTEKYTISNLTCNTNNGNFNIENAKINGKIAVSLNKGNFTLGEAVNLNKNDLDLSTNKGNLYATSSELGDVVVKKNDRAMINIKSCSKFEFKKQSAGGSINIGEVGEIAINSSSTNVNIDNIKTGASIDLTAGGQVYVKNVEATSTINTHDGDITVDNASYTLSLSTSGNGDIVVKNTKGSLFAETRYGDITVKFDETADSYATNKSSRLLQAKTSSGKIKAEGADNVNVEVNGNGSAEIYMHDVVGENVVFSSIGRIYVEFATEAKFVLTTNAPNSYANVNFLQLSELGDKNHDFNGTKSFNINTTSANGNSLSVGTESGSIKIRDVAMKNY